MHDLVRPAEQANLATQPQVIPLRLGTCCFSFHPAYVSPTRLSIRGSFVKPSIQGCALPLRTHHAALHRILCADHTIIGKVSLLGVC
jgi:hypothetical protein